MAVAEISFICKVSDLFEGVHFALKVGKFAVTAEAGGNVRLTLVEHGTERIFNVTPDVAIAIGKALQSIAVCAKQSKE